MSDTSPLASVDWATVAAAIGTLIGTIWLSIKGIKKGREKAEGGTSELTSIVGASLIETASIKALSEQFRENTAAMRENTAALNRTTDVQILTHRN